MLFIFIKLFNGTKQNILNFFNRAKGLAERIFLFKENRIRRYAVAALSLISVFGITASFLFCGARLVYKINYFGKDIAIVDKKESFDTAIKKVENMVSGKNVMAAFDTPEYISVVALTPNINSETELVNAIIENTENIVMGCEVSVNGAYRFTTTLENLQDGIDKLYSKYTIKNAQCKFTLVEEIDYKEGYYLKEDVLTVDEVNYAISDLTVKTTAITTEDINIPFSYTKVKSDSMLIGSRKVMIEGVEGKGKNITTTVYYNGVATGESETVTKVTREPVDEVINIGAMIPNYSGDQSVELSGGYYFPLPRGKWNVSAYFGDDRGHKGVDLAANAGTPIMAVAPGRVILSEWDGNYGLCVKIDHGNGFITRYAHASVLIAEVGQQVSAGDVIALVGSTGDSTGSHLHIEFEIGGTRVDPAGYLGLY